MDIIITGLIFFAVLSILVVVHECGHYFMARFIGVHVEEFGLGLPPKIWGKKIGKTLYSLNALPFGGFVRLTGEDEIPEEHKDIKAKERPHYFWARSKKERSAILVAGVTMNFLLAVLITVGILVTGVKEPSGIVHITSISPGSPANLAGLLPDDTLRSISYIENGKAVEVALRVPADLINATKKNIGLPVVLRYQTHGQDKSVTLVPRKDPPKGEGALGVGITDLVTKYYPWYEAPVAAVRINFERAGQMFTSLFSVVGRLLTFQKVENELAGPIGIAQMTGEAAKFGLKALLEFMSILSLNLAVLNILPIPALDGGRLAFVVLEKFIGKRIKPASERNAHSIGMIILLTLIVLVSISDILRLVRAL